MFLKRTSRTSRHVANVALLAMLVSMISGCLAAPSASNPAPGSFNDHAGWSEYYPAWLDGPATVEFQGKSFHALANESYATDGKTYLYVTQAGARDATSANACRAGERQVNGIWVLLLAQGCVWTPHPGVACAESDACARLR